MVLDQQGALLENTAIFPHSGAGGLAEATRTIPYFVKNTISKQLRLVMEQLEEKPKNLFVNSTWIR